VTRASPAFVRRRRRPPHVSDDLHHHGAVPLQRAGLLSPVERLSVVLRPVLPLVNREEYDTRTDSVARAAPG
jgi:hypothetical protein